jgi:hypothetical protein
MQLDGLRSTRGANPTGRPAGKPKAEPGSERGSGAKSFGDAFAKAKAAGQDVPPTASGPAGSNAPEQASPPSDSHIDAIRFRLQTGYYNNSKVDDALSDKLSGYFDDIA